MIKEQNSRILAEASPELEKSESKKFLCCFSLKVGIQTYLGIMAFTFLLLLIYAIIKHRHREVVLTLLVYAFLVFLPGLIAAIFHEVKGDKVQILRKIVMFSAWYAFAAILFMNVFIIVYIMLFVKCDTESD